MSTTGDSASGEAPEGPVVLVSLEPRSYSDTIGQVIGDLRPGITVLVVAPDELTGQMMRSRPALVLCSQSPSAVPGGRPFGVRWVEYYPYAEPPDDEILIDGRGSGQRAVELSDLLALVDRVLTSV